MRGRGVIRTLEARVGLFWLGKQEVFLLCKNPGRPLASLFSPWRGALPPSPILPMSADNPSTAPAKKKRAPGRPKAQFTHDATIQLRLESGQLAQLTEQARVTGYSRSAIIRAALDGVQVLQAAPTPEQREQYRQLVKLATNLNQLVVLARVGQDVQDRARATLDQVQLLLATLNQGAA